MVFETVETSSSGLSILLTGCIGVATACDDTDFIWLLKARKKLQRTTVAKTKVSDLTFANNDPNRVKIGLTLMLETAISLVV